MSQHSIKSVLFVFFFTLLIVFACKDSEPEKQAFIRPPFPTLEPEYKVFDFNASEGGTFTHSTGTQISIPADIWQDAEGKAVSGDITLKYREFHNAADIFLSGSTLAYDTAGSKEVFTTAGMFEIRAFKDSSELFIKNGQSLSVKMASYKADNDFNFYYLNEEAGNWEYEGRTEPEVNPMLQQIQDTISRLKAENVISIEENKMFALNYDAVVDIYYNNYPYGKNRDVPKRKAQKYGLTYSGIYGYDFVYFRGRKYQAWEMVWELKNAKRLASWTKNSYIEKLTNLGNNMYYMKVKSGDKTATYKVEAIMPLRVLFATSPDKWQEEYEQVMKRLEEEYQRFDMQAAVYRTFDVSTTGYHNWDRIYKVTEPFFVKSNYKFNKELDLEANNYDIFYFVDNNQSFIRYRLIQGDTINFAPDSSSRLIAVLSPTEAAVCPILEDVGDFEKLRGKGEHTFTFKTVAINSKEDFLKILEN